MSFERVRLMYQNRMDGQGSILRAPAGLTGLSP